MPWIKSLNEYFSFTRRDRIAITTLLILILVLLFSPSFLSRNSGNTPIKEDTALMTLLIKHLEVDSLTDFSNDGNENEFNYTYDRTIPKTNNRTKGELFYFDPNTITVDDWKKLGLREKTIRTIQNYLTKGGKFRHPEDLQRVYGLFPDEFERLKPYIKIVSNLNRETNTSVAGQLQKKFEPIKRVISAIDINLADTTAFISLPGIGSKLALRIVAFREKLGGFYSVNQISETFGLTDSTFQRILPFLKLENISVKKININTATIDELKAHPYIKWSLARPIISYRDQHGSFNKLDEIKNVMAVTDETFRKILPYLSLE